MPAYKSGFPKKNLTELRSGDLQFFASAAGDIDVIAQGGEGGNDTPNAEIHIFGAGDLSVQKVNGQTETIVGIPAGHVLPISVKKIFAAGTTCTNILILY